MGFVEYQCASADLTWWLAVIGAASIIRWVVWAFSVFLDNRKGGAEIAGYEWTHADERGRRFAMSSVFDEPQVELSVVLPIAADFNLRRLESVLVETISFLQTEGTSWEIVIVMQYSDEKSFVTKRYLQEFGFERIRIVSLPYGSPDAKGLAGLTRRGVLVARGALIFTAGMSSAIQMSDIKKMKAIANGSTELFVVVGSRSGYGSEWASWIISHLIGAGGSPDPLSCNRLYARNAASLLFSVARARRLSGAGELLLLANLANAKIMYCPLRSVHIGTDSPWILLFELAYALQLRLLHGSGFRRVTFATRGSRPGGS